MKTRTMLGALGLMSALAMGGIVSSLPTPAAAQGGMSCGELWHERNAIYARNGHCFNTARGRAVFGAGCFAPFGQLSGWEARRVNELQMWERRKGC